MQQQGSKPKRIVKMSVLPGEPLDGSGKACIHLFVAGEKGPYTEPHVLYPSSEAGKIVARPTRGYIACNHKLVAIAKPDRNGVIVVTKRTDDPRAVTCLKCKETADYKDKMKVLETGA